MKNFIIALAIAGSCGLSVTAIGQTPATEQVRRGQMEEVARTSAALETLAQTYREMLLRQRELTAEQRRDYANAIDRARLSIPDLSKVVGEIYATFRGERVLGAVSLGLGGELTMFRNSNVPLVRSTPLGRFSTGGEGSIGIAMSIVRNENDNTIRPDFAGYYSLALNESTGYGTTRGSRPTAKKVVTRGEAQTFAVYRLYLVPANVLGWAPKVNEMFDDNKTVATIGSLGGTYFGGGSETSWNLPYSRLQGTFQTHVYGRWDLPEQNTLGEYIERLDPEVVMIQLSPGVGSRGPRLEAQGAVQHTRFFGIHLE